MLDEETKKRLKELMEKEYSRYSATEAGSKESVNCVKNFVELSDHLETLKKNDFERENFTQKVIDDDVKHRETIAIEEEERKRKWIFEIGKVIVTTLTTVVTSAITFKFAHNQFLEQTYLETGENPAIFRSQACRDFKQQINKKIWEKK